MAVNNATLVDPLQGYDIKVSTQSYGSFGSGQLVGAFTSLMFKVINQTETYLPLNSRIPRMLDGEVIVVWSLEQGLVEIAMMANTFGTAFADGLALGRAGGQLPRSARFQITFQANMADTIAAPTSGGNGGDEATFVMSKGVTAGGSTKYLNATYVSLEYCRVDTYSFGVQAGKHVVANAWQGTAQHLTTTQATPPTSTPAPAANQSAGTAT